ncbi:MAG: hypothetical protein WDN48_10725 [Pseudolabrys sp.]
MGREHVVVVEAGGGDGRQHGKLPDGDARRYRLHRRPWVDALRPVLLNLGCRRRPTLYGLRRRYALAGRLRLREGGTARNDKRNDEKRGSTLHHQPRLTFEPISKKTKLERRQQRQVTQQLRVLFYVE